MTSTIQFRVKRHHKDLADTTQVFNITEADASVIPWETLLGKDVEFEITEDGRSRLFCLCYGKNATSHGPWYVLENKGPTRAYDLMSGSHSPQGAYQTLLEMLRKGY